MCSSSYRFVSCILNSFGCGSVGCFYASLYMQYRFLQFCNAHAFCGMVFLDRVFRIILEKCVC